MLILSRSVLFVSWLLLVTALALALATVWIFVPAPNRPLLALGVGAPELSPWLLLGSCVVSALALGAAARGRVATAAAVLGVIAAIPAATPLIQFPSVVRRFDTRIRAALGHDFLRQVPADRRARMRSAPIVIRDLFLGIRAGETRVARNIPFADVQGTMLTADVYRPAAAGRYPSIVQIYGGAWQRGVPGDDAQVATYLAASGFVVFAIDYRHAPVWRWPAQIEDVRAALKWIRAHADEYGADASRLALFGRSAGAHLAMIAAFEPGAPPVNAVVSYYGPVDLSDGYRRPPTPDPLNIRAIDEAFIGGTPDTLPDKYREASPITYVSGRVPPSLLIYGNRDLVVLPRFGRALDEALRAAGASSILLEIPWAEHAFDTIPNGLSGQLSLYYTEQFLTWALTQATTTVPAE